MKEEYKNKRGKILKILVGVIILFLLVAGVYSVFFNNKNAESLNKAYNVSFEEYKKSVEPASYYMQLNILSGESSNGTSERWHSFKKMSDSEFYLYERIETRYTITDEVWAKYSGSGGSSVTKFKLSSISPYKVEEVIQSKFCTSSKQYCSDSVGESSLEEIDNSLNKNFSVRYVYQKDILGMSCPCYFRTRGTFNEVFCFHPKYDIQLYQSFEGYEARATKLEIKDIEDSIFSI